MCSEHSGLGDDLRRSHTELAEQKHWGFPWSEDFGVLLGRIAGLRGTAYRLALLVSLIPVLHREWGLAIASVQVEH